MKLITHHLVKFGLVLVALTLAFRAGLSAMLAAHQFSLTWALSTLYGVAVFMSGWIFGKRDKVYFPVYDIGFRFHLATYIIFMLIAEVWHLAGFQSQYENMNSVHITGLSWGAGLLLHYVFYRIAGRDSLKGLKRSDIFE